MLSHAKNYWEMIAAVVMKVARVGDVLQIRKKYIKRRNGHNTIVIILMLILVPPTPSAECAVLA